MASTQKKEPGVRPEIDRPHISEKELTKMGEVYSHFYKWQAYRTGLTNQFQGYSFEAMLTSSRQLFWNSVTTKSDDLRELGMNLSIPFARKETLDFLGRLTSLNIKPKMGGDDLDAVGFKVLNGMYANWRFHSNDKVEKFWELLYGLVNGTVCSYIGFTNTEFDRRYLESYDPKTGDFTIKTEKETFYNDVSKEIVPIEDIYLPKIYERNVQKQGRLIWKTQMNEADFHAEFDQKYPNAKYCVPGNRIASDSLYYRLLGSSVTTNNNIEILREYDILKDEYTMAASGMLLNHLGSDKEPTISPMPFDHKMLPFTWGITSPIDEKIAYGLPTPFLVKDPHKVLNMGYMMMVERELRAIDPVILSSDIESPEFIFGQHRVINVNDVAAYKEFNPKEASGSYFNMLNAVEANMRTQAQGGSAPAVPSKQPTSAKEVFENAQDQEEAMSNTVLMYYDLIRQEILLVMKTMFQFYALDKYEAGDERVYRTLLIPDMPLTLGGKGDLKIRFVKKKQPDLDLFLENIRDAARNGKNQEIIEVPIDWLQNLECTIHKIDLEPENSDELELSNWVETVLEPMVNIFIPAKVADIDKTFLRWMEKMGESPADFATDQTYKALFSGQPTAPATGIAAPGEPGLAVGGGNPAPNPPPVVVPPPKKVSLGKTRGNLKQISIGTKFGSRKNTGLPIQRNK
jgi:hypothetical protein